MQLDIGPMTTIGEIKRLIHAKFKGTTSTAVYGTADFLQSPVQWDTVYHAHYQCT